MDKQLFYKSFMKVIDTLNKFRGEKFNFSKGIFSSYEDGILTMLTFDEKIEKNILEIFPYKFDIYPLVFKIIDKHLNLKDIIISSENIEFLYESDRAKFLSEDKNFQKIADFLYKKNNYLCVKIEFVNSELYQKVLQILNHLENKLDYSGMKQFAIDIYKEINNSELPFVIDDEKFYTRLSKSTFQNVTKGDIANIKCIPYKDKNSLIFLTVTTVNKSEYQILNVFNVLYLLEGDE